MEQLKTRTAAFAAMALCRGLAMTIALGAVAITGARAIGRAIALIAAGCVGMGGWGLAGPVATPAHLPQSCNYDES